MTIIIGIAHKGKVYMGCDSAAVDDWSSRSVANPKVFVRDGFIIGYTTSFRMGQLLQYDLVIPKVTHTDGMKYMVSEFIPAVRGVLKSGGFAKVENNEERGGDFLVGFGGKLFTVEGDFNVMQNDDRYGDVMIGAIGWGYPFALGAIGAFMDTSIVTSSLFPDNMIMKALQITGRFSSNVKEPYLVFCQEK